MARISHRAWRRIFAGVLVCALVLQGFTFAVDILQTALHDAGGARDTDWASFELCTHNGGASASPVTPAQAPVGDSHCPFCLAGTVYVNCAPLGAPQYSKIELTSAVWPLTAPRLAAFFVNENAWPRGPPAAA
jgi:hypothetical protein